MFESGNGSATARVFGEDTTGLPTRVEIQGVAGRYRLTVSSPDRTRSFTTTFDSATTVSRNIPNQVASRYEPTWTIGIESV